MQPVIATPTRSPSRRGWILRIALIVIVGGYIAWFLGHYLLQELAIFPGAYLPAEARPLRDAPPASVQSIWLTMADGTRVEAWYRPGRNRTASNPGPAVMYFHGNLDTIDNRWEWVEWHIDHGAALLAMEYRGYGRLAGKPSQQALTSDAVAFHDWLVAQPEVRSDQIILRGLSLGGGVAVALAEQRRPAALVLECTFASIAALAQQRWLPAALCRHPFRSDRVLPTLGVPVLMLHGKTDEVIPIEHARRMARRTPTAEFIELDCGHSSFRADPQTIAAFLRRHALLE